MEGDFDNSVPQKSNTVTVQELKTPESVFLSKPIIEELPADTLAGSKITFTNTLESNPDQFDTYYPWTIAKEFNLDPTIDSEKIEQLSRDASIREIIKNKLEKDSLKSYKVTEVRPVEKTSPETRLDYNAEFFKNFDNLPNSGIAEVKDEELRGVDKVYIGTSINTPAFENTAELGIYGDENVSPTYFSSSYKVAMSHLSDDAPALIEVSLSKLMEYRKILRDPESLYIEAESGKTFITFHGIPTEAIERILILTKAPTQQTSASA